jgi:guanylate kinase
MEELEQRLRCRGTEAEDKVQCRLKNAQKELEAVDEPGFVSRVIVNKDLDIAVAELEGAIAAHLPEVNIEPSLAGSAGVCFV